MAQVRIVSDSTCDIPPHLLEELEITVVPLSVTIGKRSFLDTDLTPEEFWEKVLPAHKQGIFPKTAAPSIGAFDDAFNQLATEGNEVICVTITERHSGTFNSAWAAAEGFEGKVGVVDSRAASLGHGFMVIAAAQAAREGKGMIEIVDMLEEMKERVHLFVVLDTIEFIRKGGRADKFIPILARAVRFLGIKPIITFVDGELALSGQGRTFSKALGSVERQLKALTEVEGQPEERRSLENLAVLHTLRPVDAGTLATQLGEELGFTGQILVRPLCSTLSAHVGPNALGVVAVKGL